MRLNHIRHHRIRSLASLTHVSRWSLSDSSSKTGSAITRRRRDHRVIAKLRPTPNNPRESGDGHGAPLCTREPRVGRRVDLVCRLELLVRVRHLGFVVPLHDDTRVDVIVHPPVCDHLPEQPFDDSKLVRLNLQVMEDLGALPLQIFYGPFASLLCFGTRARTQAHTRTRARTHTRASDRTRDRARTRARRLTASHPKEVEDDSAPGVPTHRRPLFGAIELRRKLAAETVEHRRQFQCQFGSDERECIFSARTWHRET